MPTNDPARSNETIEAANFITAEEEEKLDRHSWRNWIVLASVLILTTIGLASAIPPLLNEQITRFWPWVKTERVLLVGLSLTVLIFVGYMTQQQRTTLGIHRKFRQCKEEYERRLLQHTKRLYALASVSHIMSVETDLENILQSITRTCAETFGCYRASLMLLDPKKNELVVRSVFGHCDFSMLEMRQKVGEGIAGWVAEHREPILLRNPADYALYPGLKFDKPSLVSAMVVPILLRDELIGVINIASKSEDISYNGDDLRALQVFAENVGMCIRHAEHVHWLKQMIPQRHEPDQKKKHGSHAKQK